MVNPIDKDNSKMLSEFIWSAKYFCVRGIDITARFVSNSCSLTENSSKNSGAPVFERNSIKASSSVTSRINWPLKSSSNL